MNSTLRAAQKALMTSKQAAPIGVFDSGLGGLSVLHHLRLALPNEDFIYVADTAHLPYGDKSEDWMRERLDLIAAWFMSKNCKTVVLACNTATAAAGTYLRERYPDLFIVGLEPAIKPALALTKNNVIAMLATARTVGSNKYARLLERCVPADSDVQVISIACVGLAERIDAGLLDHPETLGLLGKYVASAQSADVLVLGCTHYPFVVAQIQALVGADVCIIDSGAPVARYTRDVLLALDGLNAQENSGQLTCYASKVNVNEELRWQKLSGQVIEQVKIFELN